MSIACFSYKKYLCTTFQVIAFVLDNNTRHALMELSLKLFRFSVSLLILLSAIVYTSAHNSLNAQDSIVNAGKLHISGNYVYGRVTDKSTKEPLAGVGIIFESVNSIGTVTNTDGSYLLKLPADRGTIIFSSIGYETKVIKTAYRECHNIEMTESMESLDGVIVTGYNRLKKDSFTGNSIKINQEAILNANPGNLISAIQAFDPSFRILDDINSGSDPNHLPEFVLRGQTGIGETDLDKAKSSAISREVLNGSSNLPIFILDGFEVDVEKIYDLDIHSIHSINILKDAAATAVYGSRAANGVIVIEKRAPAAGRLKLHYSGLTSIEMPDLSSYNLMNANEKLETERLAGFYDSPTPEISPYTNDYYKRLNNIIVGVDTYWLSQGLRIGIDQKHSLFIDGGENNTRWGVELSYRSNPGIMKHSSRDNTGGAFYIDYRIKGLQIRNKVTYNYSNSSNVPYNNFSTYSHLLPYLRLYDKDGQYVRRLENFGGYWGTSVNPLYEINFYNNYDRTSYNEFADNLNINWNIIKGLKLKGRISAMLRRTSGERFKDPASASFSASNGPLNGEKDCSNLSKSIIDGSLSLIFNRTFSNHDINLCLSSNIRQTENKAYAIRFRGFPGGDLTSPNYAFQVYGKPSYADNKIRIIGNLLTANYSYKDIYLSDMTYRIDGSSEFGSEKKWSVFWATGAGVNIHNYPFLKKNKTVSILKARMSYGLTGKTNFPLYSAKDMYSLHSQSWYPTGYGVFLSQKGNPNLKWERKYTLDGGIEIGLWKERVYLRIDGYSEKTIDLISDYTIPSSSGFTSFKENLGKIKNTGVEIALKLKLYSDKNWLVQVHGNFAHNENTIVELSQVMKDYNKKIESIFNKFNPETSNDKNYSKNYLKYYEGASLTSIYGMKSLGISPSNGKEIYLNKDGSVTDKWSADEWSVIGNTAPKGQGSFGMTLAFRRFSVFTSFMYTFGGDAYNHTLVSYVENADIKNSNADRRVLLERWQKPGDITIMKDIRDRNKTTGASSRFVQKDNTLRLSSLTLSYSVSDKILKRTGISGVRLSVSANDLIYLSSIHRERGLEYPFSRSCSMSITISL